MSKPRKKDQAAVFHVDQPGKSPAASSAATRTFAGETGVADDIVTDTIGRLRARFPDISLQVFVDVEEEIRHDWGGDRPYVCKSGEAGRNERSRREATIRAEHRRGEHVGVLARRWGLSIRRIQQIVKD